MPRGSINWKSADSYTRLLAAIVASYDLKLNYKKIADMYGEGATYDSIEGRFRIIKKEAEKLRHEIESGARPPAPERKSQTTPRKSKHAPQTIDVDGIHAVLGNSRVTKSVNNSPTKRTLNRRQQMLERSSGSYLSSGPGSCTSGDNSATNSMNDLESFDPTLMSFDAQLVPGSDMTAARGHPMRDPANVYVDGVNKLFMGLGDVGDFAYGNEEDGEMLA